MFWFWLVRVSFNVAVSYLITYTLMLAAGRFGDATVRFVTMVGRLADLSPEGPGCRDLNGSLPAIWPGTSPRMVTEINL